MRPRLVIIFLVLVLGPLGLVGWLGVRLASGERRLVRERVEELLLRGLADTRAGIARLIDDRQRSIDQQTGRAGADPDSLRQLARSSGLVRAVFVLGPDCGRRYPPVVGPLSGAERDFLSRARGIWPDLVALCRGSAAGRAGEEEGRAAGADSAGWYAWRWGGSDTDLIHWRRPPGGGLVGVELDSIRLLADIVAVLPDTGSERSGPAGGRVALVDAGGRVLYQWGGYRPPAGEPARAALGLAPPLDHWKLVQHLPEASAERAAGAGVTFSLSAVLVLAGLGLIGLALYFYRQQARLVREAGQRVSFVNRVSHELRTPLTNIRLYAELLAGRLADTDPKTRRQIEVIVSESGRLSRLIGNVLAFSRQQKEGLGVHPGRGRVDEVIGQVLEHFSAALAGRRVAVDFAPGAAEEVWLDSDALAQIVGNLLSNVEKYVPEGGRLAIRSRLQGARTTVRLADDGRIPAELAEKVFEPFYRVSDKLTDGVSGTGLGLGIARDLARLHGGDLRLVPSEQGTCFELSLHTPPISGGAP